MNSMKLINVKSPDCIHLIIEKISEQSNTSKSKVIRAALSVGLFELECLLDSKGKAGLTRCIIDSEKNLGVK